MWRIKLRNLVSIVEAGTSASSFRMWKNSHKRNPEQPDKTPGFGNTNHRFWMWKAEVPRAETFGSAKKTIMNKHSITQEESDSMEEVEIE